MVKWQYRFPCKWKVPGAGRKNKGRHSPFCPTGLPLETQLGLEERNDGLGKGPSMGIHDAGLFMESGLKETEGTLLSALQS
jgi:hypothetical protein